MDDQVDVLVTDPIFGRYSEEPIILLQNSGLKFYVNPHKRRILPSEVLDLGRNCIGIVAGIEQYSAATLAELPRLRCISRCGSGIDNIDLIAARMRGVGVLNTPQETVAAVSELTLAMMLGLLREVPRVNLLMHNRQWLGVAGSLLEAKIVAIIGLGHIGRRVAELVQAFGASVLGVAPAPDKEWMQSRNIEHMDLPVALQQADIVSIHAALRPDRPLHFGMNEFNMMKEGSLFINMARGSMIDDFALNTAIMSGKISGAALDVFPQEPYTGPLCDNERVILSPHHATLVPKTRRAIEMRAVKNLIDYLL